MATTLKQRRRPSSPAGYGFTQLSYGRRLLLLACIFVAMMVLAGSASTLAASFYPPGSRECLIATSVLQNIIGFCGTALLTSIFVSTSPLIMLGMRGRITARALLGVLLMFAAGLPMLNQVTWWNTQMHLPAFMHQVEAVMRQMEESALSATSTMLDSKTIGGLIVNIIVIGVFTGFSEELCFRGAIQRVIASGAGVNRHMAVWLAAVIFSLLHFQFFGFLPRVLLGAFFGYLLLWTGSIYVSAAAHALNNSLYVLLHWLQLRGDVPENVDSFGVTIHGFPAYACVSLALLICMLVGLRRYFFSSSAS